MNTRTKNTVSVIIPAYNEEISLETAIKSALAQDFPDKEIIIVNDGSIDGTENIVNKFVGKVKYIKQHNQGRSSARNAGLSLAKGEYVAFLDADDYWLPRFLTSCVNFLSSQSGLVAVSTKGCINRIGRTACIIPRNLPDRFNNKPFVIDNFFDFWGNYDHIRTGNCLIRKEIIDQAGMQRKELSICQDLEYWGYLATFGTWGFIPEVLWVGNSEIVAARKRWLNKLPEKINVGYSIEEWQKRIAPKLKSQDWEGFRRVRARVAAGLAYVNITNNNPRAAYEIVKRFGKEMPDNILISLMKFFSRGGRLPFFILKYVLGVYEYLKGILNARAF